MNGLWFIKPSLEDQVKKVFSVDQASPTDIQLQNFNAYKSRSGGSNKKELPHGMAINGKVASIEVVGVLTKELNFWAWLFGIPNSSYNDIIQSIAIAESDSDVEEIHFLVDSGGGNVSGMFDAMRAIRNANKPTTAIVDGLSASAAYGLSSQADKILVNNKATMLGSIGVAVDLRVSDSVVSISSTDAPKKRPDVTTDEGKAIVREELDAIHDIFVAEIAAGRSVEKKYVNKNFGQGGILLAEAAEKVGMIDGFYDSDYAESNDNESAEASADVRTNGEYMNKAKLKAEFPQLYSEVYSEGVAAERDRVKGHLKMAGTFGANDYAKTCIEDGTEFGALTIAEYVSLKEKSKETADRVADSNDADPGEPSLDTRDEGDVVADLVIAQLGSGV